MHRRVQFSDEDEDDEPYNEAGPDSPPSSWEDAKITKSLSKKRKNVERRVVTVPIADVEGSKSRGEVHPPSDSWAWRKYGQKPIKGSPYPRGYYRCSSSKGCPARKQVERSRVDPTKLLITYACDHNHPLPSASHRPHHHHHRSNVVVKSSKKGDDTDTDGGGSDNAAAVKSEELVAGLDLSHVDSPMLLGGSHCEPGEFGWFYDVALSNSSICAGNLFAAETDAALERGFSVACDEESLFSDLGDLPDCAAVFRRGTVAAAEEQSRRCDFGAVPFCWGSS